MKKILVIGVISGVMTILPLAEVLATTACGDPIVDNISVTVNAVCTFERTNGTGTYSTSVNTGQVVTSFTSTFKVVCNNANGFTTKGAFTSLTGTGTAISYTNATAPSGTSGTWTAIKGATGTAATTSNMIANNGTVMSSNGPTTGTSQQVSYKIGSRNNQAAGTYTGTATYTTTQNS